MSNLPTTPSSDDGVDHPIGGSRPGGTLVKWDDARGWHDRDNNKIAGAMLVYAFYSFVGRWVDTETGGRRLDRTTAHPLPDVDELNAQVSQEKWTEFSGKLEPPYKLYAGVRMISDKGVSYHWENSTWGCKRAVEDLREQTANMRMVRGDRCLPLVELSEVPWQLSTGMRKRPVLEVVTWNTRGGDGDEPAKPQISGPTPTVAHEPAAKPKVGGFDRMTDAKPVTVAEIVKDEIPY